MTIQEAVDKIKEQTKGINNAEVFVIELININFESITPELAFELGRFQNL